MTVTRLILGLSSAVAFCHVLADSADAQTRRLRAPSIRISTALGHAVSSNYIEPTIRLGEDAYVFAIAVDVDRHIQVLHPAEPGISVLMTSDRQLYLPRFFAGFSADDRFARSPGFGYSSFDSYGYSDTRGTLIALASRKPFNLALISVGGDWDLEALRRIVDDSEPHAAAEDLARYLGARGEQIGRDVHRFAGARGYYNTAYYNNAYYNCAGYYGAFGYARAFHSPYSISYFRAAQLRQAGYVVRFVGVDPCGEPQFIVYPQTFATPMPSRPPATGAFPTKRLPVAVPRNPTKGGMDAGPIVGSRPQSDDRYTDRGASSPPAGRVVEPERTVEKFRPPVERAAPPVERVRPQPAERTRPEPASGTISERPRPPVDVAPSPRAPERAPAPVYIPERISPPPPPPPPPPPQPVERERPTPVPVP